MATAAPADRIAWPVGLEMGAATALQHGLMLVTSKVEDFEGRSLMMIHPFRPVGP
jgi:hypothetical protein